MNNTILLRNNVTVQGRGQRTMVFAHGFGCDQNMWRYISPAFTDKYRIVLFDYVGSGKSDLSAYNEERYADLNGYAQDVLDVCSALELSKIVFVGHSVSCMIGLLVAIRKPELISQIIFIGPSPCYINDNAGYTGGFERRDIEGLLETMEKNYIGWANFLAPVVMKNPEKPELVHELTESFCSTDPNVARQFAQVTFFSDNRRDLGALNIPSLIMQCTDDLLAPLEVGDYLHKSMPLSTLKVLQATGHCPHMSARGETIQVMKEYLNAI